MNNLTERVEQIPERLTTKEKAVNEENKKLGRQINQFTKLAWAFIFIGIVIALVGVYSFIPDAGKTWKLNELGDFISGTVASLWSLAGLFFIYVAFLGQKQQLLNQQLEIMYNQAELQYTRLELKGQKEAESDDAEATV